ncbi:MAG: hypothetical protein WCS65_12025 [Verrucomicrobiae bacterium]
MSFPGIAAAFGLGFLYFLGAIPAGAAAGASVWASAAAAWLGYSAGGAVVLAAGAPIREWLVRKLKIPVARDPSKLVWRVWDKWGLAGLGLLAPVTIGPQVGGILALAVDGRPLRIFVALSVGSLPWCVLFACLVGFGVKIVR